MLYFCAILKTVAVPSVEWKGGSVCLADLRVT